MAITLLAMPLSLAGQTIQGVVLSAEDLSPIEMATVRLVDLAWGGARFD